MQALVLTNKGLENVSAKEIHDLIGRKVKIFEGYLTFDVSKKEELYKLAYMGRSFTRVLEIIETGKNPFDMKFDLKYDKKIVSINIERAGTHDFDTSDLYKLFAEQLRKQECTIQKKGELPLMLFVKNNDAYFCLDYSGFDLGRRDYRIFTGHDALKGNIAAGILLMAGFKKGMNLLDPFCKDGTLGIESALLAKNQSAHYFSKDKFAFLKIFDLENAVLEKLDKLKDMKSEIILSDMNFANLSSAKKNATIAGVNKELRFLKCDIDNIDLKFNKKIDLLVTMPIQPGRAITEKTVRKIAETFFKRTKEILSEKGKMVLVLKRGTEIYEELAEEFKLIEKKELMQGKEKVYVLMFEK